MDRLQPKREACPLLVALAVSVAVPVARVAGAGAGAIVDGRVPRRLRVLAVTHTVVALEWEDVQALLSEAGLSPRDLDHTVASIEGTSYTDDQIMALTEFQEQFFESVVLRREPRISL